MIAFIFKHWAWSLHLTWALTLKIAFVLEHWAWRLHLYSNIKLKYCIHPRALMLHFYSRIAQWALYPPQALYLPLLRNFQQTEKEYSNFFAMPFTSKSMTMWFISSIVLNFNFWKEQIHDYLVVKGQTSPIKTEFAPTKDEFVEWSIKLNWLARATIHMSLSKTMCFIVCSCTTTYKQTHWAIFERNSLRRIDGLGWLPVIPQTLISYLPRTHLTTILLCLWML